MAVCKACSQPLVLELDPDDFNEATASAAGGSSSIVPDDLELPCGCHFHWQCLFDTSSTIAQTLRCPSCNTTLASPSYTSGASYPILSPTAAAAAPPPPSKPQILTRYTNEGGPQASLDILPLLTEEAYLDAHPAARPARAYLTMCAEGDVGGVVDLLRNLTAHAHDDHGDAGPDGEDHEIQQPDDDDDDDDNQETQHAMPPAALLRYQDPLDARNGALHLAVARGQLDILWLLLWLASDLPTHAFPHHAVAAVAQLGADRAAAGSGEDIRGLRNEAGQTAAMLARNMGGAVADLVEAGIL
ncbi:MAG: hypothetical protein M1818_005869 [Claussenomyces sp. TS43310]|nr:MAG: hypothetical protein M1818_005869 [Claussenomyces sp. TS43310]